MIRRIGQILTVAALVVCLGTLLAWQLSRGHAMWVSRQGRESMVGLTCGDGLMSIGCVDDATTISELKGWQIGRRELNYRYGGDIPGRNRWGFGFYHIRTIPGTYWKLGNRPLFIIEFPCWALAAVSAIPLGLWLRRRSVMRRWIEEKRCLGCGYDLRASTERCPECGKAIPAKPQDRAGATADAESD